MDPGQKRFQIGTINGLPKKWAAHVEQCLYIKTNDISSLIEVLELWEQFLSSFIFGKNSGPGQSQPVGAPVTRSAANPLYRLWQGD